MQTTNEKIALLRAAMKAAGANACLIPSSDPHISEYLPAHWSARRYFSGFTGSVGNLVVTETASALWVDGRYFVQAAHQLEGSEIVLQKMGVEGVPTLMEYLTDALGEGQVLAVDGMVTATSTMKELQKALAKKGATVKSVDLVEGNWPDRPAVPASEAFLLDETYAGRSAAEKLGDLRAELAKQGAGAMVVCRLDSVAWLLNLRASDLDNTPFALAYCFVTPDDAILFINTARLPAEAVEALSRQGVRVTDYDHLLGALTGYHHNQTVLVDEAGTNWAVYSALAGNPVFTLKAGEDPIQALKGVKNPVEIENQVDVDEKLMALRGEQALNIGVSFDTIAAYGANAAMMHYHATPAGCTTLAPKGFLLVDCGGQYLDGTTDITRTYALGELTDNERTYYTYVLKSHIDMAKLQFLNTCTGGNLDVIARAPVWAHGIDYRCGTGHGVGFVGGVHEGPHNLRITNQVKFMPGMIVTDEPGIYEEGEVGIRIENELLCCERVKNQYGQFLGFEPVTYCPIDLTPVRPELLDAEEKEWLNAFHQMVREKLTPHLNAAEAAWLAEKTKALA